MCSGAAWTLSWVFPPAPPSPRNPGAALPQGPQARKRPARGLCPSENPRRAEHRHLPVGTRLPASPATGKDREGPHPQPPCWRAGLAAQQCFCSSPKDMIIDLREREGDDVREKR